MQAHTGEDRDILRESPYSRYPSLPKKTYDYSQQSPDFPIGTVGPNENRLRRSEDYRRDVLSCLGRAGLEDDAGSAYGDRTQNLEDCYKSPTGAADLEVVETLLSFSKLEAARWNRQRCHSSALELPPSPPSSQGGVSPHHPLESDVEEACDAMHLRRRTPTKDPEFGNVCKCSQQLLSFLTLLSV